MRFIRGGIATCEFGRKRALTQMEQAAEHSVSARLSYLRTAVRLGIRDVFSDRGDSIGQVAPPVSAIGRSRSLRNRRNPASRAGWRGGRVGINRPRRSRRKPANAARPRRLEAL